MATSLTALDLVLVAAIVIIVELGRHLIPAYLSEKGKNLASKEDVEELTRKVEGVKAQYLGDLERLRSDLTRASQVHKAQYETERRVYKKIWQCLIEVDRTVQALRPLFDSSLPPNESPDERKRRRLQEFAGAYEALVRAIWDNKPFYSAAVHTELQEVGRLIRGEAIDYHLRDPHGEGYWEEAVKNAEAIARKIDATCEAIRHRLSG